MKIKIISFNDAGTGSGLDVTYQVLNSKYIDNSIRTLYTTSTDLVHAVSSKVRELEASASLTKRVKETIGVHEILSYKQTLYGYILGFCILAGLAAYILITMIWS